MPEARRMFRDDLTGQGMKAMSTPDEVLVSAGRPGGDPDDLSDLAGAHAHLDVAVAHFALMEEALIETLRNALGEEFTPDVEATRRKACADLAASMIREGGIA